MDVSRRRHRPLLLSLFSPLDAGSCTGAARSGRRWWSEQWGVGMAEVGEKNEGEGARRHNHGWVFLFAPSSLAQFESPLRSLLSTWFQNTHVNGSKVQKTPSLSSLGHLNLPTWFMHDPLSVAALVAIVEAWSRRVRGCNFRRDGLLSHYITSLSPLSHSSSPIRAPAQRCGRNKPFNFFS
uniref:Uncharacterized protein n=1 Tax=Oryza nivara TaxID=4536 RepID=A0A0E0FXD6_ORYNI